VYNLASSLYSIFSTNLTADEAGLALGITFGIKDYVPKMLSAQMRIIGASHIMVLSGANISMLMNFLGLVFSFVPKKMREMLVIMSILVFVSAIPIQASVLRATIMCVIPRIGTLISRRTHSMYLLILTCLSLVALDTKILYEISFQLSFLAVLGIILFDSSNNEQEAFEGHKLARYIHSQLLMGFSAQAFTAPLIFYYFGTVSLISPVSNLILAPFITPIMGASILLGVISPFIPIGNLAISQAIHVLLFIFNAIVGILARLDMFYITY
jgi:competence protein ComEC